MPQRSPQSLSGCSQHHATAPNPTPPAAGDVSQSRYRVLAVHAHPDDESSKGAATTARYVSEGHRVKVLTCTGGERGDILNPALDTPENRENLVALRREEMAAAARVLGVEHEWLGYVDSGLPEADPVPVLPEGCFALEDPGEVADRIVQVMRSFRPHVVITYDENGGYPHPDHIMTHRVTMLAWEKAGDAAYRPELGEAWEPLKLYYTHGFSATKYRAFAEALTQPASREQSQRSAPPASEIESSRSTADEELQRVLKILDFWQQKPDVFHRVTTQVHCAEFYETRDAALLSHRTQIDPRGPFFGVDLDVQRRVWPTEEFELARCRVETQLPETELFAGLPPEQLEQRN